MDAGDPAAPAGRRGRAGRRLLRHPPGRRARPPPLRLVRDVGAALRRPGRRGPRRPRHQDDGLPDVVGHAARPGPHPGLGGRQAGRVHGGAQGALRRAAQHPLGQGDGGGGRPRRLRPPGPQDPREVHPRRAPRGRRRAQLRPRRHRQLPPADGAAVHGLRPLHLRRAPRRRRGRHVQLPDRLRAAAGLPRGAHRADVPARRDPEPDRADRRRAQGGPRGAHRDEDERARGPPLHPRAVPGRAGGGPGRPQRPRHLLPGPRRARGLGGHHGAVGRRAVPGALADLRVLPRRRGADRPHRVGRPHAAQPRQARRARRARGGRGDPRRPPGRARALPGRHRELVGAPRPGQWVRRSVEDGVEPRNVHEELMVGHAARSAEGPAPA